MATLPAMNWSLTSLCAQLTTDFDIDPSLTIPVSSCRDCTAAAESRLAKSAPLDQKNGRYCHAPSPSLSADRAKPSCCAVVSFFASVVSSAQVAGGAMPAAASMDLLSIRAIEFTPGAR